MTVDEWKKEFGKNLKKTIKDLGVTQRYFAERANITDWYLSAIIKGCIKPSILHLVNIFHALKCIADEKGEGNICFEDIVYFNDMIELENI